jgi:hypothetical protein
MRVRDVVLIINGRRFPLEHRPLLEIDIPQDDPRRDRRRAKSSRRYLASPRGRFETMPAEERQTRALHRYGLMLMRAGIAEIRAEVLRT